MDETTDPVRAISAQPIPTPAMDAFMRALTAFAESLRARRQAEEAQQALLEQRSDFGNDEAENERLEAERDRAWDTAQEASDRADASTMSWNEDLRDASGAVEDA